MGRNASKPSCSTKGSASTSELQGVARITINVSFATKSVNLAKNTVFLCIETGGQHRKVVSYLLQGIIISPCNTGLLASLACDVTEEVHAACRFIRSLYKKPFPDLKKRTSALLLDLKLA